MPLTNNHPIDWLCTKSPGFNERTDDERAAIMHFSLLWSFFEAKALSTNASSNKIISLVHKWASDDRLNLSDFAPSIDYFRERYFKYGTATEHYGKLNLRHNDSTELVAAVLKGENTNPVDSVSVLLIIVFRLRNNLFHGIKWAYDINGQLANFTHANAVLITALEAHDHF